MLETAFLVWQESADGQVIIGIENSISSAIELAEKYYAENTGVSRIFDWIYIKNPENELRLAFKTDEVLKGSHNYADMYIARYNSGIKSVSQVMINSANSSQTIT